MAREYCTCSSHITDEINPGITESFKEKKKSGPAWDFK